MTPLPFRKHPGSRNPDSPSLAPATATASSSSSPVPGKASNGSTIMSAPPSAFNSAKLASSISSSTSAATGTGAAGSLPTPPPEAMDSPSASASASASTSASTSSTSGSGQGAFSRFLRRRPSMNNRPSTSDDGANRSDGTPPPSGSGIGSGGGLFSRHRPGTATGASTTTSSSLQDGVTLSPRSKTPKMSDLAPALNTTLTLDSPIPRSSSEDPSRPNGTPGLGSGPLKKRSQRMAEHPFIVSGSEQSFDENTDLTPAPIFHNLSPTRRTMPRSPRAPRGPGSAQRNPVTPLYVSTKPISSAAGITAPAQGSTSDSSPTTSSSFSASRPSPSSVNSTSNNNRPTVTAEWLSRKPSYGRNRLHSPRAKTQTLEGAASIHSNNSGAASTGGGGGIFSGSRPRTTSLSSGEASTSGVDSEDGEVGIKSSRRRSQISSARDGGGSYQVEVFCVDNRSEGDEMKWEVTIKRRTDPPDGPVNGTDNGNDSSNEQSGPSTAHSGVQPPSSPLNLSTTQSVAHAPSSASSINLSLSLDQPTGKLVFIAFPMDLQATPRKKPSRNFKNGLPSRSPRSALASTSSPRGQHIVTPKRAVTPPPRPPLPLPTSHSGSGLDSLASSKVTPGPGPGPLAGAVNGQERDVTPPPAPNPNNSSPPRTPPQPYIRRVSQNSLWPSPSRSGRPRSPMIHSSPTPKSPAEVWTPRRTRMVSAQELGGGLYARGTVDGMSEELERQ